MSCMQRNAVMMMSVAEKAFDSRALRRALGQFPTGVCVLTCCMADENHWMTISSFNALSLEPPLVLFSVDRRALSLPYWERAAGFAINILAENQREMSDRFARARSKKTEGVRFTTGIAGAPLLPGAVAVFECAPWAQHDGGDHVLFIAEVRRFTINQDRAPLVFSKGRYGSLQASEQAAPLWPLDIHY
jgi:flavin reductase (DIM6/NTAB) family NADH-FMN oxidoreductase RutF